MSAWGGHREDWTPRPDPRNLDKVCICEVVIWLCRRSATVGEALLQVKSLTPVVSETRFHNCESLVC